MYSERGFSLVEVMVALLIVAMALPALLMRIGTMASTTAYSRDTAIANWVAENKMQEIILTQKMERTLPHGRQADDVEMAGVKWDWQTESEPTPGNEELLKIIVRVRPQGAKENLVELSGYRLELK